MVVPKEDSIAREIASALQEWCASMKELFLVGTLYYTLICVCVLCPYINPYIRVFFCISHYVRIFVEVRTYVVSSKGIASLFHLVLLSVDR